MARKMQVRHLATAEIQRLSKQVIELVNRHQRAMAGLGIYDYGARFYSPRLGRFLSPDTIVPGHTNPQNLNRFSYVTNNPLRYTDPTVHKQSSWAHIMKLPTVW